MSESFVRNLSDAPTDTYWNLVSFLIRHRGWSGVSSSPTGPLRSGSLASDVRNSECRQTNNWMPSPARPHGVVSMCVTLPRVLGRPDRAVLTGAPI